MKEKQNFQWSPEAEATFWSLKELSCTATILRYPWPGEFIIDKGAGNEGIGGMLESQEHAISLLEQDPTQG
jgi:hypothetical protein